MDDLFIILPALTFSIKYSFRQNLSDLFEKY